MNTALSALRNGSDIRGVALEGIEGEKVNLTPQAAAQLADGFLLWLSEKLARPVSELVVCVGRDSRLSGEALAKALVERMAARGVRVLDCGLATTPAMFMSCVFEEFGADGSVMVTASHLPWNRNGLKFFTRAGGVESSDINAITDKGEAATDASFPAGALSEPQKAYLLETYAAHLRTLISERLEGDTPLAGLKIVVDAGNGAGGFYAREVLAPLGADVSASQFLEPDGHFPNHIPNPEDAGAMASITSTCKAACADLGIIFDTDVDRSSAVDEHGQEINRNAIVALAAFLVAEEHPGTTVVTDSVTSDELTLFLEKELGLTHLRYRRGYRNVINKMLELVDQGQDCALAIETSGHAAYLDNYALDDGAYLATLIVCATARLKQQGRGISECVSGLATPEEAREVRMRISGDDFRAKGEALLANCEAWVDSGEAQRIATEEAGATVEVVVVRPSYEGVRVGFSGAVNGWFLLRLSLHDPIIPLNIESAKSGGQAVIEKVLRSFFANVEGIDSSAL